MQVPLLPLGRGPVDTGEEQAHGEHESDRDTDANDLHVPAGRDLPKGLGAAR